MIKNSNHYINGKYFGQKFVKFSYAKYFVAKKENKYIYLGIENFKKISKF